MPYPPQMQRRMPTDMQMKIEAARMAAEGQGVSSTPQPRAPQPIVTNPGYTRPGLGPQMTSAPRPVPFSRQVQRPQLGQANASNPLAGRQYQSPQLQQPMGPGTIPAPQQPAPAPGAPRPLYAAPTQGLYDSSGLMGQLGHQVTYAGMTPDDAAEAAIKRLLDEQQGNAAADQAALQKAAGAASYNAGEGILARFGATGGGSSGATAALMGDARVRAALEAAQQMVDARQKDAALGIQAAQVGLGANNTANQIAAQAAQDRAIQEMMAQMFGGSPSTKADTAAWDESNPDGSLTDNAMRSRAQAQAAFAAQGSNPNSLMVKFAQYTTAHHGDFSGLPVHGAAPGDQTDGTYGVDKNGNLYIVG